MRMLHSCPELVDRPPAPRRAPLSQRVLTRPAAAVSPRPAECATNRPVMILKVEPALTRQSRLNPWAQVAIRMALLFALLVFIITVHWIERAAFTDSYDGQISFSDIIYFTMISA